MSDKKLTPIEVCYKIQGFAELKGGIAISSGEWDNIVRIVRACELDGSTIGNRMSASHFVAWLQGYIEISGGDGIDQDRWKMIKEHLQLVFEKVTPELGELDPPCEDQVINDIVDAWKKKKETRPWSNPIPNPWDAPRVICSSNDSLKTEALDTTFIC